MRAVRFPLPWGGRVFSVNFATTLWLILRIGMSRVSSGLVWKKQTMALLGACDVVLDYGVNLCSACLVSLILHL